MIANKYKICSTLTCFSKECSSDTTLDKNLSKIDTALRIYKDTMNETTYLRILNSTLFDNFLPLAILKRIVTFYYNSFMFHPNIFKTDKNMSINNTEHKNCLEILKAAGNPNINFIY